MVQINVIRWNAKSFTVQFFGTLIGDSTAWGVIWLISNLVSGVVYVIKKGKLKKQLCDWFRFNLYRD